jgi:ubiquinone/menaquinone biosynthesis C-methylase UbiE
VVVLSWGQGEREEYYDRRAAEYDQSITLGLDAETAAAFAQELAALGAVLAALPPGRVLDVACGTALFTQHLRGQVVALDHSAGMLTLARAQVPTAPLVQAAVPALPFADMAFDRLVTCHFYGHLVEVERVAFVAEARRVAPELVVVDTAASDAAALDGVAGAGAGQRFAVHDLQAPLHPSAAAGRAGRCWGGAVCRALLCRRQVVR